MAAKYLVSIFLLLLIPSSLALGVSPPRYELEHKPDARMALQFVVSSGEEMIVQIATGGELGTYLAPSEHNLKIPAFGSQSFSVDFTAPRDLTPGLHEGVISIRETPQKSIGGIGGTVAVNAQVWVRIPYPEKYADIEIESISAVNAGDTLPFKARLTSRGNLTIHKAAGTVEIYDAYSKLVATVQMSASENIQFGQTVELTGELDTKNLPVGPYRARIVITYDEKSKIFEREFRIGDIILEIVNITSPTIYAGDVAKITTVVRSKWNAPTLKVYADLRISNATKTIAELKTPYADVLGWSDVPLAIYWDTKDVSPGTYSVAAKAYYADKVAEASFQLSVLALEVSRAEIKHAGYIILCLLFVLALLVLAILRLRR